MHGEDSYTNNPACTIYLFCMGGKFLETVLSCLMPYTKNEVRHASAKLQIRSFGEKIHESALCTKIASVTAAGCYTEILLPYRNAGLNNVKKPRPNCIAQ